MFIKPRLEKALVPIPHLTDGHTGTINIVETDMMSITTDMRDDHR